MNDHGEVLALIGRNAVGKTTLARSITREVILTASAINTPKLLQLSGRGPAGGTDERDQKALLGGMRVARRLFRAPPLARYVEAETSPRPEVDSDEELLAFARKIGTTVYHMIGTARLGPKARPDSAVDHELKFHGIDGLRICDASTMPSMPSANTNASTLMIAEKAADMILGRSIGK
ncbi:MAG: GMC oxidoreductase [Mesorhizobium sp.]